MSEYDSNEPLSCGHGPTEGERSIWWVVGTFADCWAGTACFDCALLMERRGHKVDMIPTNEQMLDWLDYELAGIGIN